MREGGQGDGGTTKLVTVAGGGEGEGVVWKWYGCVVWARRSGGASLGDTRIRVLWGQIGR